MSASAYAALQDFWRDDYRPLELGGKEVLQALRHDESAQDADLYRRIASSGEGAHLYFPEPSHLQVASSLVHEKSSPLPPLLSQAQLATKLSSLMGSLPEANMAWMSVDDKLYLWPLSSALEGSTPDVSEFVVPSGQCIIAVGLAKPKKGVFKPLVKWCLVVSTPDECILCALTHTDLGFSIVPTRYVLSTDRVATSSICGTPEGRIFLGGFDGSMCELAYESLVRDIPPKSMDKQWKDFYDGTADRPKLQKPSLASEVYRQSKRTIAALVSDGTQPRKCRKLNHSSTPMSSLAASILPEMLVSVSLSLSDYTFGSLSSNRDSGSIIQLTYDKERKFLYSLSQNGLLSVYDVIGKKVDQKASMSVVKVVRAYLSAVSKGHGFPPSVSSSARIEFPGGLSSAQAGVGGMEGARAILKQAESARTESYRRTRSGRGTTHKALNILMPVSIHPVSRAESAKITLLVISAGGLRYYISSLPPSAMSNMTSNTTVKTCPPHRSFTLCYIRSPPPPDCQKSPLQRHDGEMTNNTTGLAPCLGTGSSGMQVVDASYHSEGISTLALRQDSGHEDLRRRNGDSIVVALPYSVCRMQTLSNQKTVLQHPGGVSESLCMPMISFSENSGRLPGGRVMTISRLPSSKGDVSLLNLHLNSQTPTDTELALGLVPAFVPSAKLLPKVGSKGSTALTQYGTHGPLHASGIVVRADGNRASTSAIALTVLSNFLLSRPLRQGLTYRPSSMKTTQGEESLYHISKRSGVDGFGSSAAGKIDRTTTSVAIAQVSNHSHRSARLSPWLLKPSRVPLNHFAIHHQDQALTFVAINSWGQHFFKTKSVLSKLAEALMAAGANIDTDEYVSKFFLSYGYRECCAMCLMLASGCGPASGSGVYCEELKRRARNAALSKAFIPQLTFNRGSGESSMLSSSLLADPVLPKDYSFQSSSLYGGLTLVMSRLLRPVWYKALCVVTEGQEIKTRGLTRAFPAKVELLLDDTILYHILEPLEALLNLMKRLFSRAVEVIPGKSKSLNGEMEVEDYTNPELVVTGTMFYQGRLTNELGQVNGQLSQKECDAIARLVEERNIHCLYRMLSRTVQVLHLFSHLRKAHFMVDLPEVEWGMLHGLTMAQLVLTRDGQERLDGVLSSLVCSPKTAANINATPTADADQLAQLLTDQCYLVFSPGSRFAYLGLRAATEAIGCSYESSRRKELALKAANHLKKASTFWHSAELIAGRRLNSADNETHEQIAIRAIQNESPLAKAASMLSELGCFVAIVDVCLTAAANFRQDGKARTTAKGETKSSVLEWEKGLYHTRTKDPSSPIQSPGSPSASTSIVVSAKLTEDEAIKTCHSVLFFHLSKLLKAADSVVNRDLVEGMVAACAASTDKRFLRSFFGYLLKINELNVLLRINSADLETYLKDPMIDSDLLWQYYVFQRRDEDAGQLMWTRATESSDTIDLDGRLGLLTKSLNSYKTALQYATKNPGRDNSGLKRLVRMVQETLDVGLFQKRILQAVMSSELHRKLEDDRTKKLKTTLLPVSDLYNDYAAPLNLFDCCLLILHSCRYNEMATIETLWRSLLCEELLPCCTRSESAHTIIERLMNGSLVDETVVLLTNDVEGTGNLRLVEHGDWIENVRTRIAVLGKDLFGHGADYVFPLDFLVPELENLRRGVSAADIGPWPMMAFIEAGVPVETVFASYERACLIGEKDQMLGASTSLQQFYLLQSTVEVLEEWIGRLETKRAVARGNLLPSMLKAKEKAARLKVGLETLMGANGMVITREMKRVHQRLVDIESSSQSETGLSW